MPELPGDLGAERMPLELPVQGKTIAGKALDILGAYLRAAITHYAGEAWAHVAPREPIVRNVFTHDPEQYNFKASDLPALYLFAQRSARDPEQTAEDYRLHADIIRCFWVLPPTKHVDQQARRVPIVNYIGQLIDELLYRGRDASYVIDGDTDATAADEGSVVLRHAGLTRMTSKGWAVGQIAIAVPGNQERFVYPLLDVTMEVERRLFADYASSGLIGPARLELDLLVDDYHFSKDLFIGPFSTAFNSAFEGGYEGQDAFDSAFSSAFGQS